MNQYDTQQAVRTLHPRWAITATAIGAVILLMTLWPDATVNTTNLVPFRQHGAAWSCLLRACPAAADSARFLIKDVVGNVVVFVPFGYAVTAMLTTGSRARRFWAATALGLLLSLFIETVQFGIATRATDVDDLIFNTLGAVIGAGLRRR